jgi:probable HAF family extracellular repeat protein
MFTVSQFQSPNGLPFYIYWMSDDGKVLAGDTWDPTVRDSLHNLIGQCFITQNGNTTFYPTPGFSCGIGLGRSANSKGQFAGVLSLPGQVFGQTAFVNLDGTFDTFGARLPGVAHDQLPQCSPNCVVASSLVTGMNENGDVVGMVWGPDHVSTKIDDPAKDVQYGWLYSKGQITVLPLVWASGINNKGDIAGLINMPDGSQHAAIYRNGTVTDLGAFGPGANSLVGAINSEGHVGGYSTFQAFDPMNPIPSLRWEAYLYDGQSMNPILVPKAGQGSNVNWLNDNDQIVGQYVTDAQSLYVGYYYANGLAADITSLVVNPPPGLTLSLPYYITNNGQILMSTVAPGGGAYGTPVLLTPVSAPASSDESNLRRIEHARK